MAKSKKIEHIDFPNNVVNREAYRTYLEKRQLLHNHPKRYFDTTDPTLKKLDLLAPYSLKNLSHLPPSEEQTIKDIYKELSSLKIEIRVHLSRALDTNMKTTKANEPLSQLDREQIANLIDKFGSFYKISEVHQVIVEDWGYHDIAYNEVKEFFNHYYEHISKKRQVYESNFSNLRLTKKRARVEELGFMFETTKKDYVSNKETAPNFALKLQSEMRQLLREIKQECEGDLVLAGKVEVDLNVNITEQVISEHLPQLNVTALILSKWCGKHNLPFNYIFTRLNNSTYAKYLGFEGKSDEVIVNPSDIFLDLDGIKTNHQSFLDDDEKLKHFKEIPLEISGKINNFKDNLLERLAKTEQKLNKDGGSDKIDL